MRLSYEQIAQAMADLHVGDGLVEVKHDAPTSRFAMQPLKKSSRAVSRNKNVAWHWITAVLQTCSMVGLEMPALSERAVQWWNRWEGKEEQIRREKQIRQGQKLMDQWKNEGWLTGDMCLHQGSMIEAEGVACMIRGTLPNTAHHVILNVRPKGDIPSLPYSNRDRAAFNAFNEKNSTPVFRQWLVLAHEAAHSVGQSLTSPFVPSENVRQSFSTYEPRQEHHIKAINHHLLGQGAPSWFHHQFDEAFADVYGCMMLLKTTDFHPQALNEVDLLKEVRKINQDGFVSANGTWGNYRALSDYEATAPALHLMLERKTEWENLAISEMKIAASEIVSDAWLQVVMAQSQTTMHLAEHLLLDQKSIMPPMLYSFFDIQGDYLQQIKTWNIEKWPDLRGTSGHQIGEKIALQLREVLTSPKGFEDEEMVKKLIQANALNLNPQQKSALVLDAVSSFVYEARLAWESSADGIKHQEIQNQALVNVIFDWAPAAQRALGQNPAITLGQGQQRRSHTLAEAIGDQPIRPKESKTIPDSQNLTLRPRSTIP